MKKNYQLLDIAKFFFSICIIGIHTKFLGEYKIGYYIETNIFRIAVPFFFICNGYFIAKSMDQNSFDNKKLKKIVKQYFFWCLFYTILYNIFVVWEFSSKKFVTDIMNIFILRPTNIMWYLGVLMIFSLVVFFVKDKKKLKIIYLLSILGYIIGLLFVTYKYLFMGTKYEVMLINFSKYFNFNRYFVFTIMFPFIGYFLYDNKKIYKLSFCKLLFFLFLNQIFLFIETFIYYNKSLIFDEYDYFIFTPIVSLILFIILIRKSFNTKFNTTILRNYSKLLFFYHFIFIYIFLLYDRIKYSSIYGADKVIIWFRQNSLRMFLYVLISTMIMAIVINKKRNKNTGG